MILGTLSLFHKSGLFYKNVIVHSEENYTETIQKEIEGTNGLEVSDHITKHQITPVDENGDTDYIEVYYTDAGVVEYPYEVTVWLLIEENPQIDHIQQKYQ